MSFCLSVTLRHSVKTAEHIRQRFFHRLRPRPVILVVLKRDMKFFKANVVFAYVHRNKNITNFAVWDDAIKRIFCTDNNHTTLEELCDILLHLTRDAQCD